MKKKFFLSLTSGDNFTNISHIYNNEYTSFIDIYFYEYFHLALALQNILDTLSDILVKCLRFSLIKIESVTVFQAKPCLVSSSRSAVYTFLLKMLYSVLIKN
jgi:hypothetical protein